jgi:hypothetical protein
MATAAGLPVNGRSVKESTTVSASAIVKVYGVRSARRNAAAIGALV